MEKPNDKDQQVMEAIVRGMASYVAQERVTYAVQELIDNGEIKPYIGFYKHCRECGIHMNEMGGNYLRNIITVAMERKKRFRDD